MIAALRQLRGESLAFWLWPELSTRVGMHAIDFAGELRDALAERDAATLQ